MTRIAIIGAGSTVFTRNLCSDIMLAPALRDSTIALMDIDADRLTEARDLVQLMADRRGLPTRVEATLDRREAVRGADYVIIENLLAGCCVEVPCLVDGNGVQPTLVGSLPPQLAALNRACINVQELTVRAALGADPDAVHHAALLDPLTAAACTVPQVHAMVNEMLASQARWLPQFSRTMRGALP